jgi:anti-anti-sigma factor
MDPFKIESIPGPPEGTRILRLSGAFVLQQVWEFQGVIRTVTEPVTIIDLTEVSYMDSASLGALMTAHVTFTKGHRQYALVGVSDRIRMLFEVGGVDKLLIVYRTVDEALEQLALKRAAGSAR